jgi:mannose-6-phosphate isomerase-like protein (cupin superfamily)
MPEKSKSTFRRLRLTPLVAALSLAGASGWAMEHGQIEVRQIDRIVGDNPLPPDTTDAIVQYVRAGDAEIGVLVMRRNRLHHHSQQDHVLYLARGAGVARLENQAGQIELRPIKAGDILSLPRGKKHGFEKSGDENLVFLVVGSPLPPDVEETTFHE